MDTRFAHLYKRDSSVSMIRVKMSRRRSQSQKENREKVWNLRRHLDQLPEIELSMDASSLMATQDKAPKTKAANGPYHSYFCLILFLHGFFSPSSYNCA